MLTCSMYDVRGSSGSSCACCTCRMYCITSCASALQGTQQGTPRMNVLRHGTLQACRRHVERTMYAGLLGAWGVHAVLHQPPGWQASGGTSRGASHLSSRDDDCSPFTQSMRLVITQD